MTTRRKVIGGIVAAPLVATPFVAKAQEKIEWRMVTSWARDLPGPGVTAQRVVDRIREISGGRLDIKLYAGGEIVPALEVFSAVENGVAEMGHTAPLFWGGKIAAAPIFTAAPFGLTPMEHIAWIEHGKGQELWDRLYEPFGIKPFMAGNTGFQMGGWFKKELNGVEDLQGLRIRMPGLGGEVMRKLGASPVTLPPSEILAALQSGAIDATEFLGPKSDLAMGFYKSASYYYAPGWHEPNGSAELLVGAEAFARLPPDLQAVVREAARAENIYALAEAEWENGGSLKVLVEEKGVKLRDYPEEIVREAKRWTEVVLDELAEKDAMSKEVVTGMRKAKRWLQKWSGVSVPKIFAGAVMASFNFNGGGHGGQIGFFSVNRFFGARV